MAVPGEVPHRVLFPPPAPPPVVASGGASTLMTTLRRLRRTWLGDPPVYRPAMDDLTRDEGPVSAQFREVWSVMQAEAAPSLTQACEAGADVWFAHDAPTAEAALAARRPGQRVYLLAHNPMPLALYIAWCWGVPEARWEDVAALPDVRRGLARERAVMAAVDQVIVPSTEAAAELARVDPALGPVMCGATTLLTGAAGPVRLQPHASVAALRAARGLPNGVPVGLFIGNAQPYRGLDLLLAALDALPPDAPEGVVAVAGCPTDALPFHPRLRALGPVADVMDLLAAVDFVINVNRFSLCDLSTIEALQAGRALLLTPTGGNLTFASLGAGCSLVATSSPPAIADGLARCLAMDDATRVLMGLRSRGCYESYLTPEHLRARHVALYDATLAGARP